MDMYKDNLYAYFIVLAKHIKAAPCFKFGTNLEFRLRGSSRRSR